MYVEAKTGSENHIVYLYGNILLRLEFFPIFTTNMVNI